MAACEAEYRSHGQRASAVGGHYVRKEHVGTRLCNTGALPSHLYLRATSCLNKNGQKILFDLLLAECSKKADTAKRVQLPQ